MPRQRQATGRVNARQTAANSGKSSPRLRHRRKRRFDGEPPAQAPERSFDNWLQAAYQLIGVLILQRYLGPQTEIVAEFARIRGACGTWEGPKSGDFGYDPGWCAHRH